jgi:5-formyltetrahydrofolate cyclo-ligase
MSEISQREIKNELRKRILKKRSAMTPAEVSEQSRKICKNVICSKLYSDSKKLCLYMPIRNEVDVRLLIEPARADGRSVYLPRIVKNVKKEQSADNHALMFEDYMEFYSYTEDTSLVSGAYNILEPDNDEILVPDNDTLIIMPGAVFSRDNKRIGYGGGYYDRYLSLHPECKTIAVAYDFQILDEIPYEEHDICPDVVVSTEEHISK